MSSVNAKISYFQITFAFMTKKTILIIMDGWGKGKIKTADAIANANTPFVDSLYKNSPNAELTTFGEDVGLPKGQMGNSEVGHLNLGAGRIVYQELERINVAIRSEELKKNETLMHLLNYCKNNNKPLHLMGLVSDGGVHSHLLHIKALLEICKVHNIKQVFIHAFTDGRDTSPTSGKNYLQELQNYCEANDAEIATIIGRFYAMDRDKRWERVKIAYDALVKNEGTKTQDFLAEIEKNYANNITDEFLKPIICCDENHNRIAKINDGDVVLCFNFRTDRCREITEVLTQKNFPEFGMTKIDLKYCTMTVYDKSYTNVSSIFSSSDLTNTLGEVLEKNNLSQIRIAETEKYPHVSFFFSGGREKEFIGEKRIMIPSPKDVATYDLKPEMSAYLITEKLLPEIENETADFICLNFANTDMVGHTGVWEAAKKAAETVDACVEKIVTLALKKNYAVFLTADHGNSDFLINEDGTPNTAHTMNPVPIFFISNDYKGKIQNGILADVATSILHWMNIDLPKEMTGKNLLVE